MQRCRAPVGEPPRGKVASYRMGAIHAERRCARPGECSREPARERVRGIRNIQWLKSPVSNEPLRVKTGRFCLQEGKAGKAFR